MALQSVTFSWVCVLYECLSFSLLLKAVLSGFGKLNGLWSLSSAKSEVNIYNLFRLNLPHQRLSITLKQQEL